MAQLPDVFSASDAEDTSFSILPSDWYVAQIIKSEIKETRDGNGKYIALQFRIVEGDYAKRIVFSNLNIVNKSEVAVRIAKSDLKKICDAIDLDTVSDTQELHGQDMQIKVTKKPATANYPEGNEIKDYRSADVELESSDDSSPFG